MTAAARYLALLAVVTAGCSSENKPENKQWPEFAARRESVGHRYLHVDRRQRVED
jgi:hypothetical protein